MIRVSSALPVKVYLNGEVSFNQEEHTEDGIEKFCFNQEFKCDDPIKFQLYDEDAAGYKLRVVDEDGDTIDEIPFVTSESLNIMPVLNFFTNDGSPNVPWILGSTPNVTIDTVSTSSRELERSIFLQPGRYRISVNTNLDFGIICSLRFKRSGVVIESKFLFGNQEDFYVEFSDIIDEVNFLSNTGPTFSGVTATINSLSGFLQGHFHSASFIPSSVGICNKKIAFLILDELNNEVGFTDFVYISNNIRHNVQVFYKGIKTSADGLYYNTDSDYFMTRIPGRMYKPVRSGQTTSMELSNHQFITTSTKTQKKKLLEIEDAPEYFHDMIEAILNHAAIGEVKIDGLLWERAAGDEYTTDEETPDSYPLYRSSVVLSKKTGINRNVI